MKLDKDTTLKSLASFLGIILVCLICILSLLDAPEYVHCTHLSVCKFLELSGNLCSHKGIENLIKSQKDGFPRCTYLFLWPKKLAYISTHFHSSIFSFFSFILHKYIYTSSNQKDFFVFEKVSNILLDKKHISCSSGNILPSHILQIIAISVIKS